jgi:hypothetical protein
MAGFVTFEDKELKRYERDLKTFRARAFPFATKATVNKAAAQARTVARKILGERLILRNQFIERSVRAEFTRSLNPSAQQGVFGSINPALVTQEFGGAKRGRGKHGVVLPTTIASREGRGTQPRRRLPVRAAAVRNIKLTRRRGRAKNRRQANLLAVRRAAATGKGFVVLKTRRGAGFYRVTGLKRSTRVELVADISHRAVTIPPTPWLAPTIKIVQPRIPGIYRKELKRQLIRHRLFVRR